MVRLLHIKLFNLISIFSDIFPIFNLLSISNSVVILFLYFFLDLSALMSSTSDYRFLIYLSQYKVIIIDYKNLMKPNQKEEDLFHLFIQYTDKLPVQAGFFPYFEYMDNSIRKIFNQLKKNTIKKQKDLETFDQFWQELTNQDKVRVYCNWVLNLRKALDLEKNVSMKFEQDSITIQDQIYIKKTNLFNKWEKKLAKLTTTHLHLTGRSNKQYELKNYQIRKSRGKESFAWVLQSINSTGKTLHCRVNTQSMFDEWYYALTVNINNQKIQHFLNTIKKERVNPGSSKVVKVESKKTQGVKKSKSKQNFEKQKTLTEIMIDKQMKTIDHDNFTQIQQNEDEFESLQDVDELKQFQEPSDKKGEKKMEEKQQSNPNIFKRLAPEYKSLLNFTDTPFNSALLHSDSQYRIYELPQKDETEQIVLKMFTIFPFPKSLVFQAIASESMGWNDQVDVLTVKTKISSQNTVLIYEKNKAYGLLYRERDFLYLRHCFSVLNLKQKNTFMIDKSIDSIHHPPFMSVVRAEKKIIWGLVQKQGGKECILVVQGWIKGGGYINQLQNKQITLKFMKKINGLKGFLKQLSFSQNNLNLLFKQDWGVDFSKEENAQSLKQKPQKKEKVEVKTQKMGQKQSQKQKELAQFMIRTNQQSMKNEQSKSEVFQSQQRLDNQQYTPPPLSADKYVKIPQQYLKKNHILSPKQKPSKQNIAPHIRGHHIWKGQWSVLESGGLGYIDEEKMKQQKKVLTYIIKRIGKNIFSGKGILNISLPVDIFCMESNIERIAMSFGFFPFYLEKAATIKQPLEQLKYVIGSGLASSLIYLTMQKPFNPILGETFQCWVDGCPIYFEQISHHPPVAAFLMKGRGYTVSGNVEAKMDLSINSGTGNNEGVFNVQFDNGNSFYYTTPAGCLQGLTYGERKLNLVGKVYYWNDKGLLLQLIYNPGAKSKSFFGGVKGQGDEKLPDYFEGYVKEYNPEAIKSLLFKNTESREIAIVPKNGPTIQANKTYMKVSGRWNKYVKFGDETIFDIDANRYYLISDQKYPLASHCNFREDIVYRRLKNFIASQEFKQVLEIKQREDRKLRAKFNKNSSH